MKDDVPRHVAGPAVAAFDAEMEAEESGVMFTPEQWSFAKRNVPAGLPAPPSRIGRGSDPLGLPTVPPAPRARGSVPPTVMFGGTTQQIPAELLAELVKRCKASGE